MRLIEIGEAVKALPADAVTGESAIPWRDVAVMRHVRRRSHRGNAFTLRDRRRLSWRGERWHSTGTSTLERDIRLTDKRTGAHHGSVRERARGGSAAGLLLAAAAVLAVSVCVCVGLTWGHTDIDDGLSWFGTLGRTVAAYALGLVATSVLLWAVVSRTPATSEARPTRAVTLWMAVLLVGLAATPYTVGPGLEVVHRAIGSALFVGQLAYSLWVVRERRGRRDVALVVVELVSGVVCFLYFVIGLMGVMLIGQLVFQAAFLAVLHGELERLENQAAPLVHL